MHKGYAALPHSGQDIERVEMTAEDSVNIRLATRRRKTGTTRAREVEI